MNPIRLNIVAFDVPWPPHYGGICDLYFKLKHLHQAGVKIIYHCFFYEGHNKPTDELNKFCEKVFYYRRKKSFVQVLFNRLPYIVISRKDPELLKNLASNEHPILFDGIQTCYYLNHPQLKNRKRLVRANNVEHLYYEGLAKSEASVFKRLYLRREAAKLQKFESELKGVDAILCVTKMDMSHFGKLAPTFYVHPFFNDDVKTISTPEVTGSRFVLFHGNLSVNENVAAANYILDKVAPVSPHQFIIAGHQCSGQLAEKIAKLKNVELRNSPEQNEMDALIRDAHVHLLLTDQQTGIKLKLLHALRSGKHVLINSLMDDSGIFSGLCDVADDVDHLTGKLDVLMNTPFGPEESRKRLENFDAYFNNTRNAASILSILNE